MQKRCLDILSWGVKSSPHCPKAGKSAAEMWVEPTHPLRLGVFWQTKDVWLAYCYCLLLSLSVMSDSFVIPWTAACQASWSLSLGVRSKSCPLSQWYYLTILSSVAPFSYPLSSQHQSLFQWVDTSHQVAKVLQCQHHSFQWIFKTDFL